MKKELICWTHYETKESVWAVLLNYILLLQYEENPEATRLYVAERISQIIECSEIREVR